MKKIFLSVLFIGVVYASDIGTQAIIVDDYPNTPQDANYILLNTELQGSLETDNDVDWFKFKVDTSDGFVFTWESNYGTVESSASVIVQVMTETEVSEELLDMLINILIHPHDDPRTNMLNLEPGTYYIKVYTSGTELSGYNFSIDSAENNNTDWIPDAQTINYCRNYPDKCGVKPKVVIISL